MSIKNFVEILLGDQTAAEFMEKMDYEKNEYTIAAHVFVMEQDWEGYTADDMDEAEDQLCRFLRDELF